MLMPKTIQIFCSNNNRECLLTKIKELVAKGNLVVGSLLKEFSNKNTISITIKYKILDNFLVDKWSIKFHKWVKWTHHNNRWDNKTISVWLKQKQIRWDHYQQRKILWSWGKGKIKSSVPKYPMTKLPQV